MNMIFVLVELSVWRVRRIRFASGFIVEVSESVWSAERESVSSR